MNHPSSSASIWESGRLVAAPSRRPSLARVGRAQWTGAALLLLCAAVFIAYVAVLERDVDRGEIQRDEMRSRAVAEAQCESSQAGPARGGCLAIFRGDGVADATGTPAEVDAPPPNDVIDSGARVTTSGMPGLAGMQQ